jgi:uncharacterized damage-inducible protein DinB
MVCPATCIRGRVERRLAPKHDKILAEISHVNHRLYLAFAAFAIFPVSMPAQDAAPVPANPIATSEKGFYNLVSGYVIAAAEKMPEENYSFKPTPDVRTFGQLIGHVADAQYSFCATAAGDTVSPKGIEKSTTSKVDLVAALKDAVAYCNKTYAAMTDAKGSQMVKLMKFNVARLTVLSVNTAHTDEHYGNIVTYLRLKGVVPPSSEPRPAQGQN